MHLALFAIFLTLLSYSCKKVNFSGPMSISEIYAYTDQANTKCTGKLKNENKKIVFLGFIDRSNIDSANNCFDVFESPDDINSKRIQILITNNADKIFDKISKQLDKAGENKFIKIKINGTIIGKQQYINAGCIMGTYITISDFKSINF